MIRRGRGVGGRAARRASRPSGTRRWPLIALSDAGVAPTTTRRSCGPPTGCSAEEVTRARRLGGAPPEARAGRLGVRVRQRQLPGHRRHRRGRAGAAPGRASGSPSASTRRSRRGVRAGLRRDAERATAAGARSTPTTPRALVRELPFCDFGEVIDPPSADVTAHVVEMLAARARATPEAPRRGDRAGCSSAQEPDGSWFGRWGVNHVYGTGAAVPALVAAGRAGRAIGVAPRRRLARAASERGRRLGRGPALLRRPDVDRSRPEHRLADGLGAARAARGRRALGTAIGARRRLAGRHAARRRRAGTSRSTPAPGFPGDFYINYHLYRLVFPIMALGRCLRGTT